MFLRPNESQLYALKAAMEQLWGREAWYDLKECTSFRTWRDYVLKTIKAVRISIEESVDIRDEDWFAAVQENLDQGEKAVGSAEHMEQLLSGFTATLVRQVFLQIGLCPDRRREAKVTLHRRYWRLGCHRSVQYVQTVAQREATFWNTQQRRIGFDRQMQLHQEHRASGSTLPYSVWCRGRET